MFLGVAKDDAGIQRIFLENDTEKITKDLVAGFAIDYFFVNGVGITTVLKHVTLKPGPRAAGRALEVAEILADGSIVGSAEVEKT